MTIDELEDIEECVRSGRRPRNEGPYSVKIAGPQSDLFEHFRIEDPVPDGRALIRVVGVTPVAEHLVFMLLKNGGFEELRLDEAVDLRSRGVEKFMIFESSESYRFMVEGERYEWGTKSLTAAKVAEIGRINLEKFELWQEYRGEKEDILLEPGDIVDLGDSGLERFFKRPRKQKAFDIIINGRRKKFDQKNICFEDLILLAFPTPPQGAQICFTATYRRGPADNPEGSLLEGQCTSVVKGMVFNVTATDKS